MDKGKTTLLTTETFNILPSGKLCTSAFLRVAKFLHRLHKVDPACQVYSNVRDTSHRKLLRSMERCHWIPVLDVYH